MPQERKRLRELGLRVGKHVDEFVESVGADGIYEVVEERYMD